MKNVRSEDKPKKRRLPRIVFEDQSGQAIVILVLAIVGLMGFTAVAIDGGNAYFIRRNMQNAADAGVVDGIQNYLENYDDENQWEVAILNGVHDAAERNGVENGDPSLTCANPNVYVWYIDAGGNSVTTGNPPDIGDGAHLQRTDCNPGTIPPEFAGIHVLTRRDFDTFLTSIIGQPRLAAEGSAAAIVNFVNNGCDGQYAAFGLDESNPQGTLKLTGTNPSYDVTGDFYAADEFQMEGSGILRIDGDIFYVTDWTVSTNTDVWIGPHSETSDTAVVDAGCTAAADPTEWTYWTQVGSGEVCYMDALGFDLPQQVPVIPQPYSYDFEDWNKGGPEADGAAGCDTTDAGACRGADVVFGDKTFEHWGNDYYYYGGSTDWTPGGTLPTGIFFLADAGAQSTGTFTVNEFLTIVAKEDISFTGGSDISADPAGAAWKPYEGFDGPGVTLFSDAGGNAIVLSGATWTVQFVEGIFYAPGGDCQISGSQTFTGGFLCNALDSSGSTGEILFEVAYCPDPNPTITFTQ